MSTKSNSMPAFPKISPLFPPLVMRWDSINIHPYLLYSGRSTHIDLFSGRSHWSRECQSRQGADMWRWGGCHSDTSGRRGGARYLCHEHTKRRGNFPNGVWPQIYLVSNLSNHRLVLIPIFSGCSNWLLKSKPWERKQGREEEQKAFVLSKTRIRGDKTCFLVVTPEFGFIKVWLSFTLYLMDLFCFL